MANNNSISNEEIEKQITLGNDFLNKREFDKAKIVFTSICNNNIQYMYLESLIGMVRCLTKNFMEINQEQECFRYINKLFSEAKNKNRYDICDKCDNYFEYCKDKKEESIFESQLCTVKEDISNLKEKISKIKSKDDLLIDKIKNEIQDFDEKRIIEKNKSNKKIAKTVVFTVVVLVALIISTYLMTIGSLISNKEILYSICFIIMFLLVIIQIININKLNKKNKKYKDGIKRKKEVIKTIENRINNSSNCEEAKRINEIKIDFLTKIEEKEYEKENIEKKLNEVLSKIKLYENKNR